MTRISSCLGAGVLLASTISAPLSAAPATWNITVDLDSADHVDGTFAAMFTTGDSIQGSFTFDTDELNASWSRTTPSTVPGHEFTARYEFAGAPYGVSVNSGDASFAFTNNAPMGVIINNDLALTAAETNGFIADGTYDWLELLGSTTQDYCPLASCTSPDDYIPANGQEWTLGIVASDASWFADGSLIPDGLPGSHTLLLVGIDFDATGNETGVLVAAVDAANLSAVPVPAAFWLFGSGLLLLARTARR